MHSSAIGCVDSKDNSESDATAPRRLERSHAPARSSIACFHSTHPQYAPAGCIQPYTKHSLPKPVSTSAMIYESANMIGRYQTHPLSFECSHSKDNLSYSYDEHKVHKLDSTRPLALRQVYNNKKNLYSQQALYFLAQSKIFTYIQLLNLIIFSCFLSRDLET